MPTPRGILRAAVRGAYDLQKVRMAVGLRIVANYKTRLGQAPSKKERDLSSEDQNVLKEMRISFTRITDAIVNHRGKVDHKNFEGDELISSFAEYGLYELYESLDQSEETAFKRLIPILEEFEIYNVFMKPCKGLAERMSGVLLAELDMHRLNHGSVSDIFRYAGIDVAADGKGRSKRAEHLVEVTYKDKQGKTQTKKSITYNPFLKTKLLGVLADNLIRANNPKYKEVYDNAKHRYESHVDCGVHLDKTKKGNKLHRHLRAKRIMIKEFLWDLYATWRPLEGLPVRQRYSEEYLGRTHGGKATPASEGYENQESENNAAD